MRLWTSKTFQVFLDRTGQEIMRSIDAEITLLREQYRDNPNDLREALRHKIEEERAWFVAQLEGGAALRFAPSLSLVHRRRRFPWLAFCLACLSASLPGWGIPFAILLGVKILLCICFGAGAVLCTRRRM